jgi:hypothetical protein
VRSEAQRRAMPDTRHHLKDVLGGRHAWHRAHLVRVWLLASFFVASGKCGRFDSMGA